MAESVGLANGVPTPKTPAQPNLSARAGETRILEHQWTSLWPPHFAITVITQRGEPVALIPTISLLPTVFLDPFRKGRGDSVTSLKCKIHRAYPNEKSGGCQPPAQGVLAVVDLSGGHRVAYVL